MVPVLADISSSLQNLGAILILAGLLFFAMIFMSIPLCCYDKEAEATEADADEQVEKEDRSK